MDGILQGSVPKSGLVATQPQPNAPEGATEALPRCAPEAQESPPRVATGKRFTTWLNVKETPEGKAEVRAKARAAGLPLSEFVRACAKARKIQIPVLDPVALEEVRALLRDVARLGGIVKQLRNTLKSRDLSAVATAQETAIALTALMDRIESERSYLCANFGKEKKQ